MKQKRFLGRWDIRWIAILISVITLIAWCFFDFVEQIQIHIRQEMCTQAEDIGTNVAHLLQNEIHTLKTLTGTAARLFEKQSFQNTEEILNGLEEFAQYSSIIRTKFITLDGYAYTSYAGYLGRSDQNLSIGGTLISDIKEPTIIQPFYSEDIQKVVFGAAAPVSMGNQKGILISDYNVEDLYKLFHNKFSGNSLQTGIVAQDGATILGRNVNNVETEFGLDIFESIRSSGAEFAVGSLDQMKNDMAAGRAGQISYTLQGISRYTAYLPSGINDWYVMVMLPESVLNARLFPVEKNGSVLVIKLVVIMTALFAIIIFVRHKEEKSIRKVLREAAMLDGLTHIYNRAAADQILMEFMEGADRNEVQGLFVLDLDAFKQINDTYGHPAGDRVLIAFADKLRAVFGNDAAIGRMGGDEFIALYKNCESCERVYEKAVEMAEPLIVKERPELPPVSISIGIALFPEDASTYIDLYQKADKALYQAKRQGKNGFAFYKDISSCE